MGSCSIDDAASAAFSKYVGGQLLRINALLLAHTVLMVVLVGIGAYGHRYRHHRLIRYLFLGVTTLFLPIVSYTISTTSNLQVIAVQLPHRQLKTFSMVCDTGQSMLLAILLWSVLVQIVGISTTIIVAGDAREARDIAPSVALLVEAIWTCYLWTIEVTKFRADYLDFSTLFLYCSPWALLFAKLLFKYYSWYKARQSLALGHNPPLIAGYMEQLQADRSQHVELASEHMPPPLIVTGEEDTEAVQKQPHGYSFKWISNRGDGRTRRINNNCLVTMDKVWQMCDKLPSSTAHEQLKDVCFSFALFKLLRCRFAGYTVADAGFINFLRHVLLEERDDEGVLGLIACELTFLHDYYYSSLPISYSKSWLPILGIFISLLSMGYCLFFIVRFTVRDLKFFLGGYPEIQAQLNCFKPCDDGTIHFGNYWFLIVPLLSLIALILLAEVREIASYICSNWTKIALIRWQASWQQSPTMKKWVGHLLQCRCKMLKHWEDTMNLCSIIEARRTPLLSRLRRLISLPDKKKKVPTSVKVALVQALRSHVQAGNIMATPKLQLQVGDNLLWTFSGAKGTADIMLVCHVATSILEVRSDPHLPPSDHKIAATHLSQYCAYLVAYCPELLPDFDLWCKSLYKAIKKEAGRIGVAAHEAATSQVKYQMLLEQLMSASEEHEVLKNGAELGKKLVELPQGEDKAWELLAGFWSEMILHVAPSDNLDGHAQAIARGGELITLLWALLSHLGKPDYTAPDAAC